MKQKFEEWNPKQATLNTLAAASKVIAEYEEEGFVLSLRQLYYQLVSKDIIPNSQREYKRLGTIIGRGRLAGLVDWNIIEDRGRTILSNTHWSSPAQIIRSAAAQFRIDKWEDQPHRIYVIVEKDALSGVLHPVCQELDVTFSANKGYASLSHIYQMAQKTGEDSDNGQEPIILYFGDFDPSGMDMDRDIEERMSLLSGLDFMTVSRMALTEDQIDEYNPPPNPAKLTDSRAEGYIALYGDKSWELDALEPRVLADLVRGEVLAYRDDDAWERQVVVENEMREKMKTLADNWTD